MSKMKTKSGAKKRFKFTAKGKIKTHQVGKRHRLINNSPERTPQSARHWPSSANPKPGASSAGCPTAEVSKPCPVPPFRTQPRPPQQGSEAGQGLYRPPQEQHHHGQCRGR